MAFKYTPETGTNNIESYPTDPTDETAARQQFMDLFGQVRDYVNIHDNYAVDTGAANAYVVTLDPVPTAYTAGMTIAFKAVNANTTTATLNVNSLGVKTLMKKGGTGLFSGDIPAGMIVVAIYDGTNFQTDLGFVSHEANIAPHAAATNIPRNTTANLTYYVATTGSNSNNGLTVDTPFLTIAKATSLIPQIVNHTVTINIAVGTYAETVTISGYLGIGTININGAAALTDEYLVNAIYVSSCSIPISVTGIKCITTSADAVSISNSTYVAMSYIKSDVAATSKKGFMVKNSLVVVYGCLMSNRYTALYADQLSTIASRDWTAGEGNTFGIVSSFVSTVGKTGTQPQGATPEATNYAGIIR